MTSFSVPDKPAKYTRDNNGGNAGDVQELPEWSGSWYKSGNNRGRRAKESAITTLTLIGNESETPKFTVEALSKEQESKGRRTVRREKRCDFTTTEIVFSSISWLWPPVGGIVTGLSCKKDLF